MSTYDDPRGYPSWIPLSPGTPLTEEEWVAIVAETAAQVASRWDDGALAVWAEAFAEGHDLAEHAVLVAWNEEEYGRPWPLVDITDVPTLE